MKRILKTFVRVEKVFVLVPDDIPSINCAPKQGTELVVQQLRAASAMGKIEERGNCVIFAIAYSLML